MPRIEPIRHWSQLTRLGIPDFAVCRRDIVTQGVEIRIGDILPAGVFSQTRLRHLYEQRRITPVLNSTPTPIVRHVTVMAEEVGVASESQDSPDLLFSLPSIPVVEESQPQPKQAQRTAPRPRRGARTT